MNILYNNLVKSFSNSDWKSVKYYRDEIKAFSELSDLRETIRSEKGPEVAEKFDKIVKKEKRKGWKVAAAIAITALGMGYLLGDPFDEHRSVTNTWKDDSGNEHGITRDKNGNVVKEW